MLKLPESDTNKHLKQAKGTAAPAAATNAAAASFAGLTKQLDYLSAAEFEQVRLAYRFADEAH